MEADDAAWLSLARVPGLGPAAFLRLLRALGGPEQILAAAPARLQPLVTPALLESLLATRHQPLPADWRVWLDQPHHFILTLADSRYPSALLQLSDPPPLLFAMGDAACLTLPALAVVGSRKATLAGQRTAERLSRVLAQAGLCIVSGLAAGIDAAAHRGALDADGRTIAVVGTGLDRVYPARHRALAHAIAERGLLLSEFALGAPPLPAHFPRRNRIISGLSRGCLVVEAALDSGSLITARLALEQGRDVFAVPGPIDAPQSEGCHRLIKQGACLVDRADDVLEEFGLLPSGPSTRTRTTAVEARPAVPDWLDALGYTTFDADEASHVSGLTAGEVCAILFEMEMAGLVVACSGGRYQRLA